MAEDQLTLLALGYDWATGGSLASFGQPMSGGGRTPGVLLQLVIGGTLKVWPDYRAPTLLMGMTQLAAVTVLGLTLRAAAGDRATVFFLAVYWLSPWRLWHSGFLWAPGFVFLPAAVHMACAYRLREEGRLLPSAVLIAAILLTLQIHPSFLVLAVATAILIGMKTLRLNLWGAAAGALAGGLTMIPTALASFRGDLPRLAPAWGGDLPPLVGNAVKALIYWFRFGSLDIGRRLRGALPFTDAGMEGSPLAPIAYALVVALVSIALLSIAIAVVASWQYFRRGDAAAPAEGDDPAWLRRYALAFLLAVVVSATISPVTIQAWHLIIALHAACIPVAFWLQRNLPGDRIVLRYVAIAFVALMPVVALTGCLTNNMYQRPTDVRVIEEQVPAKLDPLFRSLLAERDGQPLN